jgi:hypothetical protein
MVMAWASRLEWAMPAPVFAAVSAFEMIDLGEYQKPVLKVKVTGVSGE